MLQAIVFLSGAVLMSLEMVGSRLLAPTFGSSIYVWGSLIVVVMAALTLGYYYGGRLADKYPNYMVMGTLLAFAGVYIGFLPFWVPSINNSVDMLEPRLGSLLASMVFFFAPSVLLATISPYGIKLGSRNFTTIGNTAGFMAAISSGGSIFGTLLTSFFLIPAMGVRNIVHTLGGILLLLSLAIFLVARKRPRNGSGQNSEPSKLINSMICFVILGGMLLIGLWSISDRINRDLSAEVLYERDSLYHHIRVIQDDAFRRLHFDESFQSEMDLRNPLEMAFIYTSYLHLGVVAHPAPSRILFIGLGGGSAPKKFLHDYPSLKTVDVVEIDPEVVKVARRYFKLPDDPKLHVFAQDGRIFVEKKAREIASGRLAPYDMVIIDAYNASSIPYHLTTREFMAAIRKTLSPKGVVVSNIIGAFAGPSNQLLSSMTRTVSSVFPQVYLFPTWDLHGEDDYLEGNVILVATSSAKYWDAATWQKQADALYTSGAIKENVPEYVKTLADGEWIRNKTWLAKATMLTDDFAPVDTLRNPL
ncbi:MAG: spermidine synthase [Bacillota bacterium]